MIRRVTETMLSRSSVSAAISKIAMSHKNRAYLMKCLCLIARLTMLLIATTIVRADLDKCPEKQRQFQGQAAAMDGQWNYLNTQVTAAQFPRVAFQAEYRKMLEQNALHDLEDGITAHNLIPGLKANQKIAVSKAHLQIAAKIKVELSLKRPENIQKMEYDTKQAENYFHQKKADRLVELAKQKKDIDNQLADVQQKLNASCTYDFPSQTVRIAQGALDEKAKIEDGVLQFMTRNLPLKEKQGQLWFGDHPILDLRECPTFR